MVNRVIAYNFFTGKSHWLRYRADRLKSVENVELLADSMTDEKQDEKGTQKPKTPQTPFGGWRNASTQSQDSEADKEPRAVVTNEDGSQRPADEADLNMPKYSGNEANDAEPAIKSFSATFGQVKEEEPAPLPPVPGMWDEPEEQTPAPEQESDGGAFAFVSSGAAELVETNPTPDSSLEGGEDAPQEESSAQENDTPAPEPQTPAADDPFAWSPEEAPQSADEPRRTTATGGESWMQASTSYEELQSSTRAALEEAEKAEQPVVEEVEVTPAVNPYTFGKEEGWVAPPMEADSGKDKAEFEFRAPEPEAAPEEEAQPASPFDLAFAAEEDTAPEPAPQPVSEEPPIPAEVPVTEPDFSAEPTATPEEPATANNASIPPIAMEAPTQDASPEPAPITAEAEPTETGTPATEPPAAEAPVQENTSAPMESLPEPTPDAENTAPAVENKPNKTTFQAYKPATEAEVEVPDEFALNPQEAALLGTDASAAPEEDAAPQPVMEESTSTEAPVTAEPDFAMPAPEAAADAEAAEPEPAPMPEPENTLPEQPLPEQTATPDAPAEADAPLPEAYSPPTEDTAPLPEQHEPVQEQPEPAPAFAETEAEAAIPAAAETEASPPPPMPPEPEQADAAYHESEAAPQPVFGMETPAPESFAEEPALADEPAATDETAAPQQWDAMEQPPAPMEPASPVDAAPQTDYTTAPNESTWQPEADIPASADAYTTDATAAPAPEMEAHPEAAAQPQDVPTEFPAGETAATAPAHISHSPEDIQAILQDHLTWLNSGGKDGRRANFRNANLQQYDLSNSQLTEASFRGANLYGVNFSGCDMRGADLSEAQLSHSVFHSSSLAGAVLSRADLRHATFENSDLQGADFNSAFLGGATLAGLNLSSAIFLDADLQGVNLTQSSLISANLRGANLSYAYLTSANLSNANCRDVRFDQAILDNAVLEGANLKNTSLQGASLLGTDLSSAGDGSTEQRQDTLQAEKEQIMQEWQRIKEYEGQIQHLQSSIQQREMALQTERVNTERSRRELRAQREVLETLIHKAQDVMSGHRKHDRRLKFYGVFWFMLTILAAVGMMMFISALDTAALGWMEIGMVVAACALVLWLFIATTMRSIKLSNNLKQLLDAYEQHLPPSDQTGH